ncbi:MAG TPA: PAC2 family protein [Streptosporangiaceae bacterium]|nr:PAC2 family protein [Streptosporangiaceae bacterium]
MARNPADLYEVGPAAPDADGNLVLLYYLDGFIDAGAAGRLLTTHLLTTLDHEQVARFDIDSLLDYRSRRPVMTFSKDHWDDYDAPELAISLLRDTEGTPFLLLAGLEPDREWEAFTAAVMQLSADLRARLVVGFHGIPMGVPHTRQLGVTAHATQPELIEGYRPLVDNLQVPGSAAALLEYRLGAAGRGAMGFAVHVPHYLAQAAYPAAAVTLLESVQRATGLVLPADALREAARRTDLEIARQVEGSTEVAEVVQALEQQYDAFTADRESLLATDEQVPTAEELGAQFERFLAEQQGRDNQPRGDISGDPPEDRP